MPVEKLVKPDANYQVAALCNESEGLEKELLKYTTIRVSKAIDNKTTEVA